VAEGTGTVPLGHEVFQIDTRMAGYEGITAGYLIRGDRPCLVETGTAPSAPVVRDALAGLGIGPGDLATVVVTHIHLDHAGGAGDIAAMFPAAQIVVHQRGARHLADPSRLMASARMVYGDALERLFGELAPVPAGRIVALGDTGTIDLGGGRRLDSHYSPGHAKHHVGLVDSETGDLYVGDAAGVYLPDTGDVRPATPPPDFDLETALASVRGFAALRRRSSSGSRKPAGPAGPSGRAWTWTTPWPWCVTAPWTGTRRWPRTPIPPWPRSSSGRAAPPATWRASWAGSRRPTPAAASAGET